MNNVELKKILHTGENESLEFKSSFGADVIESLTAFANTHGGKVIIGVSDSSEVVGVTINPESVQNWINEVKNKTSPSLIPESEIFDSNGKQIVILSIQEYPIKPVSTKGKYLRRVTNSNHILSTSEVVNMHLQTFNTSWDYHLSNQFKIDDISFEKVQKVIDNLNHKEKKVIEDPLTFLIKNDLIRDEALTNAAYLLFKKNDSILTTIELGRFQTDIIIKDTTRTKADILTQVEQVMDFVKKHINKEVIITGDAKNIQRWQYPIEAIREIVMNMIVHRDYRSSSDSIVKVFNDKIEFYNPGRLPENISINDLLTNNYKSTPRNKLVADFFKTLGLIEKYGSGIRRIIDYCASEGLITPEFKNISDGFMVTVFAQKTEKGSEKGSEKIITLINKNPSITIKKIAELLGVSTRAIEKQLATLKEKGLIKRSGPDKGGHWIVIPKGK